MLKERLISLSFDARQLSAQEEENRVAGQKQRPAPCSDRINSTKSINPFSLNCLYEQVNTATRSHISMRIRSKGPAFLPTSYLICHPTISSVQVAFPIPQIVPSRGDERRETCVTTHHPEPSSSSAQCAPRSSHFFTQYLIQLRSNLEMEKRRIDLLLLILHPGEIQILTGIPTVPPR